jgi:hypothetical protein
MPNSVVFARALLALHEAGVLRDKKCKAAVKIFIRQSSEDAHWNNSTHYRSKSAAKVIAEAQQKGKIRSGPQYHAFCKKKENGLRHEHMIPGEVVYKLITQHPRPSLLAFARILRRTGFRATITEIEDGKLQRETMPEGFTDRTSPMYFNHLARYIEAGFSGELEKRSSSKWCP